jgi:hypothetical protein
MKQWKSGPTADLVELNGVLRRKDRARRGAPTSRMNIKASGRHAEAAPQGRM